MNLSIQAFDSIDAFDALHDEWNDLLHSSPRDQIFLTWEWQSNWWASYQPGQIWVIALRDEDSQLVALAPWFIDQDHEKGRLVRSIGCVEVTDYLEVILKPGYEAAALETLTGYTRDFADRYDALDFCNIPGASPLFELWKPILEKHGYTVEITQQEVSPVIELPDTYEDYLSQLDKKNRHEVRRKLRRADACSAVVDWYFVNPHDDIEEAVERFLHLMRSSHPEKAIFLEDPQNLDFFGRVVPPMLRCGWLLMSFLTVDGQDAAAYLSFDYNNRILLYNSGLDPTLRPELSFGIVLLVYIIRDAIERGRDAFDFLRGGEEYKHRAGGVDTPVMMIHARLN
jgi:CelD/BcsL family acetyltransferase involved in cellulose biosynthesis